MPSPKHQGDEPAEREEHKAGGLRDGYRVESYVVEIHFDPGAVKAHEPDGERLPGIGVAGAGGEGDRDCLKDALAWRKGVVVHGEHC